MKSLLILALVCVALAIPAPVKEQQRLIQFSETRKEWLSVSEVEKLIVQKDVHFMDVTDFVYPEEVAVRAALPIPTELKQQGYVNGLLANAQVANVVGAINGLSEFYTRYYQSATGVAAAQWLQMQYENIAAGAARTDITVTNFTNTFPQSSVIATIPGSGPNAASVVIIGGHLDSVGSTTTGRSPGADDDASGSATVLEVFRVLVEADYTPDFTVQFIGYAGEEGGLLGSQAIAADYVKRGVDVYAALQLDMTGYTSTGTPSVGIVTDFTSAELNAFVRLLVPTYTTLVQSNKVCGYACSDHASWNRTGFRSAFPFETVSNNRIHSANDLLNLLSEPQLLQFTNLGIGFVVELAGVIEF